MANSPDGAQQLGSAAVLLTTEVTERAGAIIARLVGEVDPTTVDSASAAVDRALDQAVTRSAVIVLDLTEVTFFASVGLSLLVKLRQVVTDRAVDVRLAAGASAVLRPLQLMGLDDLFPTYPTVDDALGTATGRD